MWGSEYPLKVHLMSKMDKEIFRCMTRDRHVGVSDMEPSVQELMD